MSPAISAARARKIISSLSEYGIAPEYGAYDLNVGTDYLLRQLEEQYLKDLLPPLDGEDGTGVCRFAVAPHGDGKTQFNRCVQWLGWRNGYLTSFVKLTSNECPFDRADKVYRAVASRIEIAPADFEVPSARIRGLDKVLLELLNRKFEGLFKLGNEEQLEAAISWVREELSSVQVESYVLRDVVVVYLLAALTGHRKRADLAAKYLRGEPLPRAQLNEIDVYEPIGKDNGFRRLRELAQLIQRSGLATGLIFLFDEARSSFSTMANKTQKNACDNLLNIINDVGDGELPGAMFVFAVMPEFFTKTVPLYSALQQRSNTRKIDLQKLEGITEPELLLQISRKINACFTLAYEAAPTNEKLLEKNAKLVVETVIDRTRGSGTRRLFVKVWAQLLLEVVHGAEFKALTADSVNASIDGAIADIKQWEKKESAPEEE